MNDTVHVVAQFSVRPEAVDDFISAAKRLLVEPTRSEAGCMRYELCQDQSVPTEFMMLETWASDADLDRHLAQDTLGAVLHELRPLVAAAPVVRRLQAA